MGVSAKKADEIVDRIEYEGFVVVDRASMTLSQQRAEAFYAEHKGKGFFAELVKFMASGPIVAMKLERENAIKHWRSVMDRPISKRRERRHRTVCGRFTRRR